MHAALRKIPDYENFIIIVLVVVVHVAIVEIDVPRVIVIVGILAGRPEIASHRAALMLPAENSAGRQPSRQKGTLLRARAGRGIF